MSVLVTSQLPIEITKIF